ncbi:MAG: PPOX class F420-dependent oxidoreductase [Halobacteria archaeon]
MPESIPDGFMDLFERESLAVVGTVSPDGIPHLTPVWIDYDGEKDRLLINTTDNRRKVKNVLNNPRVGICVLDPETPYRYLSIQGDVDGVRKQGAMEHIDEMAARYMDVEEYPNKDVEEGERVVLEIRSDNVMTYE